MYDGFDLFKVSFVTGLKPNKGLLSLDGKVRIARAEHDGTRAETRFRLSPKRTSPFKSVGGVSSVDCWQPRCAHQLE